MTFTRDQIDRIEVGKTLISHGIDGRFGTATPVTSIYCKREDIKGKLFVCGYRAFGDNAQISFSIKEGDETDARHYRITEPGYAWFWMPPTMHEGTRPLALAPL